MESKLKNVGIEVKRFYLPLLLKTKCPNCGSVNKKDFSEDYLMYPETDQANLVGQWCDNCETEYTFEVTLKMSLTLDKDSFKVVG